VSLMVRIAPRYDPTILALARRLDDRREPIAEIVRRVAREAESRGLTRPSYVHLRRLILDERWRQDEIAAARSQIASDLMTYRVPDLLGAAERLRDARSR
jgi:hypothetical protein